MANMQYMQAQSTNSKARYIETLGGKAVNEINKQYGKAVDDMFDRLHKQKSGFDFRTLSEDTKQEQLSEIGGGYTRVGFGSKADRDRFVTDMIENGVEATYATEKVGGQWLVEIPNFVQTDSLKGELAEATKDLESNRVSSQAILKDFTQRSFIPVETPTPVEVHQEANFDTVQVDAHKYFTQHLEELGRVIHKAANFTNQLEAYSLSDENIMHTGKADYKSSGEVGYTMGHVKAGSTRTAVVLNGDTVLVGGQIVTDERIRNQVVDRHRDRMAEAERVHAGDFILNSVETVNKWRENRNDARNAEVTQRINPFVKSSYASEMRNQLHPVLSKVPTFGIAKAYDLISDKGLGKEVYEVDMYNPQAKAEVKNMLVKGGFDTSTPEIAYRKNGDVLGATYLNDEGKRVTIIHKHNEIKPFKAPISQVYASKKAIQEAAYKQEYTVGAGKVRVAEAFKDIQLSQESVAVLNKYFALDAAAADSLSVAQIRALNNWGRDGVESNLSLREREELADMLQRQVKTSIALLNGSIYGTTSQYSPEEIEAMKKAVEEIKLSEQEKLQKEETDNHGNIMKDFIKIDFGLAEIEAVAEGLNVDWQIAHASEVFTLGTPKVTLGKEEQIDLFGDMLRNGGRLDLTNKEFDALKKLHSDDVSVRLTVEERYHLQNALEKYERMNNRGLTEADKKTIESLKDTLKLSDSELISTKRIVSVEHDLGIPISSANFTPDKIMKMNEALIKKANAAGINIFASNGKHIDVEKLKMLAGSPELLKRLEMSGASMSVMIDVNKAQITNPDMLGLKYEVISLVMKMDDSGSIAELYNAGRNIYTGVSYAKSGVIAIRNRAEASRLKKSIKKANKSGYGKGDTVKKRKPKKAPKKDKAEKLLYNASAEKLEKMGVKTKAAQDKALKKAARKENSIAGRYAKTKAKVMTKLANSPLGKLALGTKELISKVLIKPAAIIGGILIALEGIIVIIMIVLMTIAAFLDGINPINIIHNALAPETYADTVAYTLYEDYLVVKEKDWLEDDLQNFNKLYKERVNMRYGSAYEDFDTYMARFPDIVLKDEDGNGYSSNVWLNPFYSSGVSHDGIIHEGYEGNRNTGKYNGTQTVTVGANNNVYGLALAKDESSSMRAYTTIESGHTCNIKDILCMTDVMYGMDLSKVGLASEDEAHSLLGMSPEQVSFDDAVENVKGFFKWLWNVVQTVNPFSEHQYEPLMNFCNDKVGMKTIIKYAETLYESSHQQEISLDVEYHNSNPLIIQTEYGAEDITDSTEQREASMLGYCTSPVTTKFYLKWNVGTDGHGARVSPYFSQNEDGTGIQYITDLPIAESGYRVQVDMSNMKDTETPCMKTDMHSDEPTYNYIKNDLVPLNECWKQTKDAEVQNPVTKAYCYTAGGGTGYYTRRGDSFTWHDGSGGWYDNESDAKNAVENDLRTKYDNATLNPTSYFLAGDRSKFTKTFYEKPAFSVDYNETTTQERITGYHNEDYTIEWYWSEPSGTGITTVDCGYGADWCVRKYEDAYTPAELGGQPVWYATGFRSEADAQHWVDTHGKSITSGWYSICIKFENKTRVVSDYSTFYHSSGNCVTVEKKIDEFVRECEGHDFQYCGGHIGMHSHGIVYSISNEQIAMSTVRDETTGNPIADGFDLEANRFDKIKGKIIHEEVDYGNAVDAASSGGCASPWLDPQGSISGMYGLNLKLDGNEWGSGYGTRVESGMHLMRDIFDIDTNVLKGDNIFPLKCDYKNFEGWTEDNITLAILKWAADWYEEYGFDIPQELWYGELGDRHDDNTVDPYEYGYDGAGQAALSANDIEAIIGALKDKYGSSFDEEREEAIRFTLGFVGKGHYSDKHQHNFLAEPCEGLTVFVRDGDGHEGTVTYKGCCTAGDEDDFTNFIRLHFGKTEVNGESGYVIPYSYNSGTSNALPADVVAHKSTPLMSIQLPHIATTVLRPRTLYTMQEASKFKTAIFIGIVDDDIELSTGQIIKANVPIVVDLTQFSYNDAGGIGNIYLHGRMGDGDFSSDAVSFDDYEWLYNDVSKTRIKRFN